MAEPAGAAAPGQDVRPSPADATQLVRPGAAAQNVVAGAASEQIVAAPAVQDVASTLATQHVAPVADAQCPLARDRWRRYL